MRIGRLVLFGIVLGVVLAVCGAVLSAGGHNFVLMMLFFPWPMLLASLFTQLPCSHWSTSLESFCVSQPIALRAGECYSVGDCAPLTFFLYLPLFYL